MPRGSERSIVETTEILDHGNSKGDVGFVEDAQTLSEFLFGVFGVMAVCVTGLASVVRHCRMRATKFGRMSTSTTQTVRPRTQCACKSDSEASTRSSNGLSSSADNEDDHRSPQSSAKRAVEVANTKLDDTLSAIISQHGGPQPSPPEPELFRGYGSVRAANDDEEEDDEVDEEDDEEDEEEVEIGGPSRTCTR